jgi:hypothetical protein
LGTAGPDLADASRECDPTQCPYVPCCAVLQRSALQTPCFGSTEKGTAPLLAARPFEEPPETPKTDAVLSKKKTAEIVKKQLKKKVLL